MTILTSNNNTETYTDDCGFEHFAHIVKIPLLITRYDPSKYDIFFETKIGEHQLSTKGIEYARNKMAKYNYDDDKYRHYFLVKKDTWKPVARTVSPNILTKLIEGVTFYYSTAGTVRFIRDVRQNIFDCRYDADKHDIFF